MFEGMGAPVHVEKSMAEIDPTLDSCCQREVSYMYYCVSLFQSCMLCYHNIYPSMNLHILHTSFRLIPIVSKVQSKKHFVLMIVSHKQRMNVDNSLPLVVAMHSINHLILSMDLALGVDVDVVMIPTQMEETMNCWQRQRRSC